ncbi:hypothetical protein TVAG_181270 [Trichomonas vaginalis G3]|uniref:TNFR-Cys domain-containing protein n=1 Tax=Trichomonas vaginalis (strain ATCC PRA-98 / G3) TaxID=412133 RepID=A2FP31_TRIV3|nr:serine-type endopeptidase protein [Trichomonas vaginalis G3]EAX93334.1 hypothetical protein TVAG_181270 [Trichomonas vaginalis G3]KAI5512714.1 serine-type endopeptidase protein [Trichomonas vaginalis G3]|eukprot:XP_001306264.1 hypothetical protein [Trichomonas vaginalis G3]
MSSFFSRNNRASGGKGSYISAVIYNDNKDNQFRLLVGGKGTDFVANSANGFHSNSGSFPDGGDSGDSSYDLGKSGSAGGGGSSSVIFNNILILSAAGGSGASGSYKGAPGGDLQHAYKYEYDPGVKAYLLKPTDISWKLQCEKSSTERYTKFPPSGFGGGNPCGDRGEPVDAIGDTYKSVSTSGRSFYNPTFMRLIRVLTGSRNGKTIESGYIKISNYCSDKNCYNCYENRTNCTLCKERYSPNSEGKCECTGAIQDEICQEQCNSGYFPDESKTCQKCPNHCKTCNSLSNCTKCDKGYHLSSGNCNYLASQPYDIYQISNFNRKLIETREINNFFINSIFYLLSNFSIFR